MLNYERAFASVFMIPTFKKRFFSECLRLVKWQEN